MARPKTTPGRVADALRQVVQRIDPDRRLAAYRVWTFWTDEVGPAVAARAEPAAFRDGARRATFVRQSGRTRPGSASRPEREWRSPPSYPPWASA